MPMYVRTSRRTSSDFLKWNPDKSQAKEVTPDNASRTQVAVNSEGKTNEATKHVKEPAQAGTDRAYHGAGTKARREKAFQGNENVIRHH